MTAFAGIRCDHPGCERMVVSTTGIASASIVRAGPRAKGWTTGRRKTGLRYPATLTTDYCPDHSKES